MSGTLFHLTVNFFEDKLSILSMQFASQSSESEGHNVTMMDCLRSAVTGQLQPQLVNEVHLLLGQPGLMCLAGTR